MIRKSLDPPLSRSYRQTSHCRAWRGSLEYVLAEILAGTIFKGIGNGERHSYGSEGSVMAGHIGSINRFKVRFSLAFLFLMITAICVGVAALAAQRERMLAIEQVHTTWIIYHSGAHVPIRESGLEDFCEASVRLCSLECAMPFSDDIELHRQHLRRLIAAEARIPAYENCDVPLKDHEVKTLVQLRAAAEEWLSEHDADR